MLQKRIEKIGEYFRGFEITNGVIIVKVALPPKWGTFPSEDERIKVAPSQEVAHEWFYYADYDTVAIEEVFNHIEETVKMNLSTIAKLNLLNEKFEELKMIFATESLERLENLIITFKDEPKKTKKTATKKKKNNEAELETQVVVVQDGAIKVTVE